MSQEENLAEEAAEAATKARENIERFLEMQSRQRAVLIMIAHDQALKDAVRAAELAESNIKRYLELGTEGPQSE